MIRFQFTCTLLEDVVLNARTATEGKNECLDFIPGSNFLGIVAKSYDDFERNGLAYSIFHSGEVRFGDAHPYLNGERAIRVPASWFHKKGETLTESPILIHGHIPDDELKRQEDKSIQIKQARSGFFFPHDGSLTKADWTFSLKSAQDRESRRAEEGKLFGYTALKKGSQWSFFLECDDESTGNLVAPLLEGLHHVGRSQTAQYGTVRIERVSQGVEPINPEQLAGEVCLYAESRLALYDDKNCRPTAIPSAKSLGLPEGSQILPEKSQIRKYTYAPWNNKRKCRDADRVCIEKGSVITVKLSEPVSANFLKSGVGSFRSEGFGRIIVNPVFLVADKSGKLLNLKLRKAGSKTLSETSYIVEAVNSDIPLKNWLLERKSLLEKDISILEDINTFVKEKGELFKSRITSSQWGQIRSIANSSENWVELEKLLFRKATKTGKNGQKENSLDRHLSGFLVSGKSIETWKRKAGGKELRDILKDKLAKSASVYGSIYAIRLASAMQALSKSSSKGREKQ